MRRRLSAELILTYIILTLLSKSYCIFTYAKRLAGVVKLTQGDAVEIERVRLVKADIAIEGRFALPLSRNCQGTIRSSSSASCEPRLHQADGKTSASAIPPSRTGSQDRRSVVICRNRAGPDTDQPAPGCPARCSISVAWRLDSCAALERLRKVRKNDNE